MSFILHSFEQFNMKSFPNILFGKLKFDYSNVCELDFKNHEICYPDLLKNCVSKRKAEYLAGRLCAKNLFRLIGLPDSQIQLLPQPDRLPTWPNEYIGSISHISDCAVVGITNDFYYTNLGVDIECFMDTETANSVASQIATPHELSNFPSLEFPILLTLIFSIKEAIYKAIYFEIRKLFNFDAVMVTDICLQNLKFAAKLNYKLSEKYTKNFILSGDFILNLDKGKVFAAVAK